MGSLINRVGATTMAFAIAHSALAGAALGLMLQRDVTQTAFALAVAVAAVLGPLADYTSIKLDLASMAMFSAFNALTLIFIVNSPGPALATERVGEVLWGSVLAVTGEYLAVLAGLAIAVTTSVAVAWGRLLPVLFDRLLAEAEGLNTKPYVYSLLVVSGVAIALTLRIVGGFLIFSLLYIPAAASMQLFEDIRGIVATSALMGAASGALGVLLSFALDLPVGCSIVLASIGLLASSSIAGGLRRLGR